MDNPRTHNSALAWQWISFAVIASLVWLVYAPSLMHVARADQIMYLAEVGHKHSLWDLTIGSMDLNRHRLFGPGDEILFRPVVYVLLGLEKYFFGNQFMLWQTVGIALHLTVLWQLLRLLLLVYTGLPAIMFVSLFALMFVNLEMVTWQHINGYMIFAAVSLMALRKVWEVLNGKEPTSRDSLVIFLLLLLAGLTHEMGNVVALVLGTAVFFYKPQHRLFYRSLLLVPAVYLLASLLNAWSHPFTTTMYHQHQIAQILSNGVYALGAWTYVGLFPFDFQWLFAARNMIAPEEIHLIKWPHVQDPAALLAIAAVVLLVVFSCRRRSPGGHQPMIITAICFVLSVIFALIIAVGRGSQWHIWEVIRINTYYMYIFWLFICVGVFTLVPWNNIGRLAKIVFCTVLAGLILLNAQRLYAVNDKQVRDNNDIIVLVNTLEMFTDKHKGQPGFSFYVDPKYPGNYVYSELRRFDDPKTRQYNLIEVLYPEHYTDKDPQYKFLVK